jgi:hypothetical protein
MSNGYLRPLEYTVNIENKRYSTVARTPQTAVWRMLAKYLSNTKGGTKGFREGKGSLTIKVRKEV